MLLKPTKLQKLATMRTTTLSRAHLMLTEDVLALLVKSDAGLTRDIWVTAPLCVAQMVPVSLESVSSTFIQFFVLTHHVCFRVDNVSLSSETCFDENYNAESCAPISDGGCECDKGYEKCGADPSMNLPGFCTTGLCCLPGEGELEWAIAVAVLFHMRLIRSMVL